jgi:hypothetical protein
MIQFVYVDHVFYPPTGEQVRKSSRVVLPGSPGCLACGGSGIVKCAACDGTSRKGGPVVLTSRPRIRRAVVFALDRVNPASYNGWAGACPGTVLDATNMVELLRSRGYTVTFLINEQATMQGVYDACVAAGTGMVAGDKLFVYGSSHGSQVPDRDGDEGDGLDETVCLWDGQFVDDRVYELLVRVPEGVEVDMMTDCCHSDSNFRGGPPRVYLFPPEIISGVVCSFTHYAGCGDAELSFGSAAGGVFTNAMLGAFTGGISRRGWFYKARRRLPDNQIPRLAVVGDSVLDKEALA